MEDANHFHQHRKLSGSLKILSYSIVKYSIPFVLFSSSETITYKICLNVLFSISIIFSHMIFFLPFPPHSGRNSQSCYPHILAFMSLLSVPVFLGTVCIFKFCYLILLSLCEFLSYLIKTISPFTLLRMPNSFLKFSSVHYF